MSRTKGLFLCVFGVILSLSTIDGSLRSVSANTMVTGTVFCDQCKDGQPSFFDYPLSGAKVAVICSDGNGVMTAYKEEDTNWFGSYSMNFDESPDLSGCSARVVDGPSGCGAVAGPPQPLRLLLRVFGMAMYGVAPLLSQPEEPMGFCPHASAPPQPPILPTPRPTLPAPPSQPGLPPFGRTFPMVKASACPHDKWMMPQYKCYWRVVTPETRVAIAFGPIAAGRYGMDMTLWDGLQGRGDLYRTLLREAITSLLNSYNSLNFFYPTMMVIGNINQALLGSREGALMMALKFRRVNSGSSGPANITCNFSRCS